jgi:hypothetical protein
LTDIADFPGVSCYDIWGGAAFGGIGSYTVTGDRARVLIGYVVPMTSPIYIPAGLEFYCFHVNITSTKTVGEGSCPGCDLALRWVLQQITVRGVGGVYEDCVTILNNNCVGWQGGHCICTPARNITWGQVKGLYR